MLSLGHIMTNVSSLSISDLSSGGRGHKLIRIIAAQLVNGKFGGVQGLLEHFDKNGMQNQLASWISTRPNETIAPAQVEQALGAEEVEEIGREAGLNRTETSQHLAQLIPQFIDKLTPTGVLPDSDLLTSVMKKLTM